MNRIACGSSLAAISFAVLAQAPERPQLHVGDTWTYHITTEKGRTVLSRVSNDFTVTRVTAGSVYYSQTVSGAAETAVDQFAGTDWSRTLSVNGTDIVVNRPFSFPLTPGKSWDIEYRKIHPTPDHAFELWRSRYTVVGTEDVTVPAGTFHAFKVEAEGGWVAELEPAAASAPTAGMAERQRVGGRTYKAFWYAPEVKRWIRSIEEYFDDNGERVSRFSSELVSWKVQP
ncbi:hypothetical protein [Paludibacterium yongneupense]|uniref:hypothetical protein n=1 Tax=Paludibacterium yongneupense TaxID=400061 RepID=UPI00041A7019|nr:hypothetical protein [Paludibacterium yongneupense]